MALVNTALAGKAVSPSVISRRCNPYGHESGGPKRLLGGLYGPEYEGERKWTCENPATLRTRMECPYGHRGQVMELCEDHAREIQRRQAGLCPPCAYPPEARMWTEVIERSQQDLAVLNARGQFNSARGRALRAGIESAGARMTELSQTGVIRKVPLKLTEIS